jgi:hypothetical protein
MNYREKDRWLSHAFGAIAIPGKDKRQQELALLTTMVRS